MPANTHTCTHMYAHTREGWILCFTHNLMLTPVDNWLAWHQHLQMIPDKRKSLLVTDFTQTISVFQGHTLVRQQHATQSSPSPSYRACQHVHGYSLHFFSQCRVGLPAVLLKCASYKISHSFISLTEFKSYHVTNHQKQLP